MCPLSRALTLLAPSARSHSTNYSSVHAHTRQAGNDHAGSNLTAMRTCGSESIFLAANVEEAESKDADVRDLNRVNLDEALMRFEFMQCLVRIAIAKYVRSKIIPDVSEALEVLINTDVLPNLPAEATHDPDLFRRKRLYCRSVSALFEAWQPVLQPIFDYYASLDPPEYRLGGGKPVPSMSIDEWLSLLRDCKLLAPGGDNNCSASLPTVSQVNARLCFSWSIAFCSDDLKRRDKCTSARYVDFLDALGRLCTFVDLPSDEVVSHYNAKSIKSLFDDVEAGKHQASVLIQRADWATDAVSDEPLVHELKRLLNLMVDQLESAGPRCDKSVLAKLRFTKARSRTNLLNSRGALPNKLSKKMQSVTSMVTQEVEGEGL